MTLSAAAAIRLRESAPGTPRPGMVRRTRADEQVRLLVGLLIACLALQRLRIPAGGQLPLLLPIVLAGFGYGFRRGLLRVDTQRAKLGLVALGAGTVCSAVALLSAGSFGASSYLFVVLTYVPFVLVTAGSDGHEVFARVTAAFVRIMAVIAVVCIGLTLAQYAGLRQPDLVAAVVPKSLLLANYNTDAPLTYGSPILRSNGLFFLEPSFASQFLAAGILAQLWLRRGIGVIPLLLAAMITTVAGTGPTLLACGLAAALAGRERRLLVRLAPLAVFAGLVALLSPLGKLFLARAKEGGGAGTSTGQRFQLPFSLVLPGWLQNPAHFLVGDGAGTVTHFLDQQAPNIAVVPLVPVKLLFEYGLLGTVPFFVFILYTLVTGARSPGLAAGFVIAWALLSGGLVQPVSIYPMFILAGLIPLAPALPGATTVVPVRLRKARSCLSYA